MPVVLSSPCIPLNRWRSMVWRMRSRMVHRRSDSFVQRSSDYHPDNLRNRIKNVQENLVLIPHRQMLKKQDGFELSRCPEDTFERTEFGLFHFCCDARLICERLLKSLGSGESSNSSSRLSSFSRSSKLEAPWLGIGICASLHADLVAELPREFGVILARAVRSFSFSS